MSWIALHGRTNRKHTLDWDRGHSKTDRHYAMCEVELNPTGDGPPELQRCEPCEDAWERANPRRTLRGHAGKLPRCVCPTCKTEHIDRGKA